MISKTSMECRRTAMVVAIWIGVTACGDATGGDEDVLADLDESCLAMSPASSVDFGVVTVGEETTREIEIENCAESENLHVVETELGGDERGHFVVDESVRDRELVVAPGETESIGFWYQPEERGEDEATVELLANDADESRHAIDLVGEATEYECPEARAEGAIESGDEAGQSIEVSPTDVVELSGAESTDPDDSELTYRWRLVKRPELSHTRFEPGDDVVDPSLRLDVPGDYRAELTVVDEHGLASCESSAVEMTVVEEAPIHVQLAWETERDLDLHLVHDQGSWGDDRWSVHALNTAAYWNGALVYLDRDSLTGEWPENIYHRGPESGARYHVGAHGPGPRGVEDATASVVFDGELVFQGESESLEDEDALWYVGYIDWFDDEPEFTEVDAVIDDHPL